MKKRAIILSLLQTSIICSLISCSPKNQNEFSELVGKRDTVTIKPNETYTVNIDSNIGSKNYVKIVAKNSDKLTGKFVYHNLDQTSQVVNEEFYLEKATDYYDFKQFFDAFRPTGYGRFKKCLDKIEFTNINSEPITLDLSGVYISGRELPTTDMEVYLTKGSLKVGADLSGGGTLTYLERLNYYGSSIDEIINNDDKVYIGVNAKGNAKKVLSSSVNLINYYDAGRQFQQSFYAAVGGHGKTEAERQEYTGSPLAPGEDYPLSEEQNGYQRHWCYTASSTGYYWPYNPVQGGDCHENISQVIDYEVTKNYIYIKTRALDWAYDNSVTKSYMENRYEIDDGVLYVKNRFINWAGFTYDDNVPMHSLELPAAYVVHPLHNLVVYKGTKPWTGDMNYDRQSELGSWAKGAYKNEVHKEDWFAWVNDEDFGVACYIPGAGTYASGRSNAKTDASYSGNSNAYESTTVQKYLYNKKAPTSQYTSCYVGNTDYTAPVCSVVMKDYIPFEYTYVLSVDQLSSSRSLFKSLYQYEMIDNSGLKAWN